MTEKDDFWESLFKVGALIGGAWLFSEIIKSLSNPVYRCPSCNNVINEGEHYCPHCNAYLEWPTKK